MNKSEFDKMVDMLNQEESSLDISNIIVKKQPKKWFSWKGVVSLALVSLLVLPVMAVVSELSDYLKDGFVYGQNKGLAENINQQKGQKLDLVYPLEIGTLSFDYVIFDEREATVFATTTLNEDVDPWVQVTTVTSTSSGKHFSSKNTFHYAIGSVDYSNAKINGEDITNIVYTDSFMKANIRYDKGEQYREKKMMFNFIFDENVSYPSTLSFDFRLSDTYLYNLPNNTVDSIIYFDDTITIPLAKEYIEKPITVKLNKDIEIDGNKFTLQKLEFTNVSTLLYVKTYEENSAYLGDLLFAVNGGDSKLEKYTKQGLKRIGKDDDEVLIFVGESRMADLAQLNELQLMYAGLIDKDSYFTTLNLDTLEIPGSEGKIKQIQKDKFTEKGLYVDVIVEEKDVIQCIGTYDRGNIAGSYPIIAHYNEDGYLEDKFILNHSYYTLYVGDKQGTIPIIFRGMRDVYLNDRFAIKVKGK